MSLFTSQFDTSAVARACGVTANVVHNYLKRDLLSEVRGQVTGGGGRGKGKHFTFYNVMEVAIARALMEAWGQGKGDPERAFIAAEQFAHFGEEYDGLRRHPAVPFEGSGHTLFVVGSEGQTRELFIPSGVPGADYHSIWREIRSPNFTIINASRVFETVVERLGADPADALAECYAE